MLRGSFDQALMPLPSVVKGVQACRLPAVRPLPSVVRRRSSLPFASPQAPQTAKMPKMLRGSFDQALMPLPTVVKGVQACRLPAVRPLPSVVKGVQAFRLPALKPLQCLKRSAAASTRQSGHCPLLLRAFKPAVCQPPWCWRHFRHFTEVFHRCNLLCKTSPGTAAPVL